MDAKETELQKESSMVILVMITYINEFYWKEFNEYTEYTEYHVWCTSILMFCINNMTLDSFQSWKLH